MRLRELYISILCVIAFNSSIKGEVIYTKADSLIFESYITQLASRRELPASEILTNTAKFFLDRPYVASTLEGFDGEKLVVNLREFDCVTFVESCLALSLTLKSESPSFNHFCDQLKSIRYRGGNIDGYCSRLHYTSDWIYENKKSGIINDISKDCGGKLFDKDINFMTRNPHLYKQLKDSKENLDKLKVIEKEINNRNRFVVLPSFSIDMNKGYIKNGDIIVFATKIGGLDYSHIGIAYWQKDKLHFIHASSTAKKVIIEAKTLDTYCRSSKTCLGISILEVN